MMHVAGSFVQMWAILGFPVGFAFITVGGFVLVAIGTPVPQTLYASPACLSLRLFVGVPPVYIYTGARLVLPAVV